MTDHVHRPLADDPRAHPARRRARRRLRAGHRRERQADGARLLRSSPSSSASSPRRSSTAASSAQFQLGEQHSWIPQFGVSYALGVDGIALVLILMALVLTPICLLAAWHDVPEETGRRRQRVKTYFALLLVLETFMVGVFAATDVFLFYVFFEAMLIPVYFLIGRFGGPRRQYAAMKFLLFSLAGGLIMLVAVIALYLQGPGGTDGFLIYRSPASPSTRPPSGCSSSASSSPSRSRRRWCRSTRGCPTPRPSPRRRRRRCSSACSTRSARSG